MYINRSSLCFPAGSVGGLSVSWCCWSLSMQSDCCCQQKAAHPATTGGKLHPLYLCQISFFLCCENIIDVNEMLTPTRSVFFRKGCGDVTAFLSSSKKEDKNAGGYWGQVQLRIWAKARIDPGWVVSSLQGPYWWQRLPRKVPTAHLEQFWGSVSCSRLKDTSTCNSVPPWGSWDYQWPSNH